MTAEQIARSRQTEPLLCKVKQSRPAEYVYLRDQAVQELRNAVDMAIHDSSLITASWGPWMVRTAHLLAKLDRIA
jgi:hypothetical protein